MHRIHRKTQPMQKCKNLNTSPKEDATAEGGEALTMGNFNVDAQDEQDSFLS